LEKSVRDGKGIGISTDENNLSTKAKVGVCKTNFSQNRVIKAKMEGHKDGGLKITIQIKTIINNYNSQAVEIGLSVLFLFQSWEVLICVGKVDSEELSLVTW